MQQEAIIQGLQRELPAARAALAARDALLRELTDSVTSVTRTPAVAVDWTNLLQRIEAALNVRSD